MFRPIDTISSMLEISDVAKRLKISDKAVIKLIKDGRLKACNFANKWRLTQSAVDELIANSERETLNKANLPPQIRVKPIRTTNTLVLDDYSDDEEDFFKIPKEDK